MKEQTARLFIFKKVATAFAIVASNLIFIAILAVYLFKAHSGLLFALTSLTVIVLVFITYYTIQEIKLRLESLEIVAIAFNMVSRDLHSTRELTKELDFTFRRLRKLILNLETDLNDDGKLANPSTFANFFDYAKGEINHIDTKYPYSEDESATNI